jgi:hypothetical protein
MQESHFQFIIHISQMRTALLGMVNGNLMVMNFGSGDGGG